MEVPSQKTKRVSRLSAHTIPSIKAMKKKSRR